MKRSKIVRAESAPLTPPARPAGTPPTIPAAPADPYHAALWRIALAFEQLINVPKSFLAEDEAYALHMDVESQLFAVEQGLADLSRRLIADAAGPQSAEKPRTAAAVTAATLWGMQLRMQGKGLGEVEAQELGEVIRLVRDAAQALDRLGGGK